MWRNQQSCRNWWRRSTSPNFISIFVTCWMRGFWAWTVSALRSHNTMGSWYSNHVMASSKSSKFSSVEGGRYVPMRGVPLLSPKILQLTTFGPWNHVDLTLRPFGRFRATRRAPPCARPSSALVSGKQTILYGNLL